MCDEKDCIIKYPSVGDTCCCGGTIYCAEVIKYEEHYICNKCGAEWWHD